MNDPYRVLGISKGSSDDDIKKAYRTLSRKYHPDANINNPNKSQAEEKFKEIQEAYNQIIADRERGEDPYGSCGGFGGFWGAGGQSSYQGEDQETLHFRAAANYINSRHYIEAMNVLDNMEVRSGLWYYYHAISNAGLGNNISAVSDAEAAVQLEPGNYQYQQLLTRLGSGSGWYQSTGNSYGLGGTGMGDCCMKLMCFNLVCGGCCC